MLILAGVSLNAIIGDNGIITNAQNATIESKCAELEEYIQEFYVSNYDHFSENSNKISALKSFRTSSNWIYSGKFGYILDKDGNIHYYLDCDNLPKEMQDIIGNWTSKQYNDYVDGNDCWGVTEELKVYYAQKQSDGTFKYYGVSNPVFGTEKGDSEVFSTSNPLTSIIGGNTVAATRTLTNLSLNSGSGVNNFNDFYNFIALDKLVLSNMEIDSLNGLEYCTTLRAVFFTNCTIKDYSALAGCSMLRHIYFETTTNDEIRKFCDETVGIGQKDLPSLRNLGIYGFKAYSFDYNGYNSNYDYYRNTTAGNSSFSNISYLSKLSTKTKESITKLYLNNNSIDNIDNLWEFPNVSVLRIEYNKITSLAGLYDSSQDKGMNNLSYLFANNNLLGKDLETGNISVNTDSLHHFSKATLNNDNTYSFTKVFNTIVLMDLSCNTSLRWINYLKPLNTLSSLYLNGCTSLENNSVITVADVIIRTGTQIDSDYAFYIALNDNTTKKIDLSSRTLTKTDFETILNGKTQLTSLNLYNAKITENNGNNISDYNTYINNKLKTITTLQYLSLRGLSGITTVDFIEGTRNLKQLDLRGTSATDLTKLNTYMTACCSLVIDNAGIDITKIQDCFNRIGGSLDSNLAVAGTGQGIQLCTTALTNQIANCTRITKAIWWDGSFLPTWCTLDFRNCPNLNGERIKFLSCNVKLYFPVQITRIGDDYGAFQCGWQILNPEELVNLKYFSVSWNTWSGFATTCNKIPNLETIDYYGNTGDVDFSVLTNPSKYKNIYVYGYIGNAGYNGFSEKSLKALGNFTNLKVLKLAHAKLLTKFPEEVKNLTNLESVNLSNTGISELEVFKNMNKLSSLNVQSTLLYETGFYVDNQGKTIDVDNMEIIKNLNAKVLRYVYLSGTNITDFSKISGLTWNDKNGF